MRFMQTVGSIALGCLLIGCSADGALAALHQGDIVFTLDGATCHPATPGDALRFYVDGQLVLTDTLMAGQSVTLSSVEGGSHDIAVTFDNGSILQAHKSIMVPNGGKYQDVIMCSP